MEVIIDAKDLILGRMASYAAKLALEGYRVYVINCEECVISGDKNAVLQDFLDKIHRGNPHKGPFYPKRPDRIVKRVIRGMLPRKTWRGRMALKRIKCYLGFPEELKKKNIKILTKEELKKLSYEKLPVPKYVRLGEIAELIGWRRYV